MIHPTCGASLQKSTRLAAVFQLVTASAFVLLNINALISVFPLALEESAKTKEEDPGKPNTMTTVLLTINTAYWTTSIFLAILLLIAANQRDLRKCRAWLVVTSILTILFIVEILIVVFSLTATAIQITSPVVATFLLSYIMWIVHAFMGELRMSC